MDADIIIRLVIGFCLILIAEYFRNIKKDVNFSIGQNKDILLKIDDLTEKFNVLYGEHKINHK